MGNPAGVCILEKPLDEFRMQEIAAEMNLSETAFALPLTPGKIYNTFKYKLRWFTPKCEVNLCGHATLATAKVLYDIYEIKPKTITFETKSGDLNVKQVEGGIRLDFPAGSPEPVELPGYFKSALGLNDTGMTKMFHSAFQCTRNEMLMVRLMEPAAVKMLLPNFALLNDAEEAFGCQGIIVTAMGDDPYDFTSRFFAPGLGINEDPVTGAAHTVLGPYWAAILDKKKMNAFQASKRGGEMTVELRKDPKGFRDRVLLTGRSVIVIEGVIKWRELTE